MFFSRFELYILYKLLLSLAITASLAIVIVWLIKAIQEVDIVLASARNIFDFLQITLLAIAPFAIIVLPLALTVSTLHVIASLNEGSELTAANAFGISRFSLLKSFLFVAMLVAIIIYILSLWASPLSLSHMRTKISQMRADIVGTVLQEGEFQKISNNVTFHIAARHAGGKLSGLFIRDNREKNEIIYLADEAYLQKLNNENYLVLQSGHIQRRNGTNYSIVDFDSYTYDLSTLTGRILNRPQTHREITTYSLFTLPSFLFPAGSPEGHYRAELHNRLTVGIYPLAFVFLIVATFGYPRVWRMAQRGIRFSIFMAIAFIRCLGIVVLEQARHNDNGYLLLWLVPLLALVLPILYMSWQSFAQKIYYERHSV